MKVLGILNEKLVDKELVQNESTVSIAGAPVHIGSIDIDEPYFDENDDKNKEFVLLRVLGFSCNYRDKAIILKSALQMSDIVSETMPPITFFGSDFVACVVKKGKNVSELEVGDRVIPDCEYPDMPAPGVASGVVTNEASKGWLRINQYKLMKISSNLSNEVAAGFSIGAQTSQSMVRRTKIKKGEKALVLSGKANTSLFIIKALTNKGIDTTVVSTSKWNEKQLSFINPAKIKYISRDSKDWYKNFNGEKFNVIFDPFYDLHVFNAVHLLEFYGRYITCGFKNQHDYFREKTDKNHSQDLHSILLKTMINNISLIGNCIGTTEDLKRAVTNYRNKDVAIDGVYSLNESDKFLDRTYNKFDRFGKDILLY